MTPQHTPQEGELNLPDREAIARIVDPEAWEECFPLEGDPDPVGAEIFGDAITESLAKADAILSMISASPSREAPPLILSGDQGPSCADSSGSRPQEAVKSDGPMGLGGGEL